MAHILHQIEAFLNQPNLLFTDYQSTIRVLITSIFIYFMLILILNIFGTRSISSLSVHDYIVTLAMGSILSSTIIFKEVTIVDGLLSILFLLILQYFVTFISSYSTKTFSILNPNPKVLFLEGEFIEENIKANQINRDEIYSAIRIQGETTSDNIFGSIRTKW